jgi:hypothetical protein
MGWQMAVVGALGAAQYQAQGAAGKYNQAVQERNALIAEQEAKQLKQQSVYDMVNFNKDFNQLQGTTTVKIAKAGVTESGSALRILRNNAEEAELNRNIIEYNSSVAEGKKLEQANAFRIQGQFARQASRMAQIGTLFSTGSSLLSMNAFANSNPMGSARLDGASSYTQYYSNPTGYSGSF